jgi:hypothetical protein
MVALPCVQVFAQDSLIDRIRSGLRGIGRGVEYVGQKADDLLGPGLDSTTEPKAEHSESVTFSERYPVDASPVVSLSNQFGDVRIETWTDAVVQIEAVITVGADRAETAAEVAKAVAIQVDASKEVIEAHTVLPEVSRDKGLVSTRVDYTVTVPQAANLVLDNFFGDTYVRGAGGLVAVEAQYGGIQLQDIGGPVTVRSHGDFPVEARGLAAGGMFELNGGQATFAAVRGALRVNGFRSNITLDAIAPDMNAEVASESGSIRLVLPPGLKPDLTATVRYGNLNSALALTRTTQGRSILGRLPAESPAQRISLLATFGDIVIEQEAVAGEAPTPDLAGAKPFNDVVTRSLPCPPGAVLQVQAIRGDIRIEAAEVAGVTVSATRVVWTERPLDAPAALNALEVQTDYSAERCSITTLATADLTQMGAAAHQVNLLIQAPAGTPIQVVAADGQTRFDKLAGAITVTQTLGSIRAADCTGRLELSNQSGEVVVERPGGEVVASALFGDCVVSQAAGPLDLQCREGKTIVDGAAQNVTVRNSGGDVRIIAINGVGGAYDVRAESASVRMLVAPTADASLTVATTRGEVHSVHSLQGVINGERREFNGRLQQGAHAVRLEAIDGNVYLD